MSRLVLRGGRVLDPGRGVDLVGDVEMADGVVTAVAPPGELESTDGGAADVSGLTVGPGFVDLHTHLYEGVSHYGIPADEYCLGRGVTTAVDAGSSGAQTFPGFRRYVIEHRATRILAFLHIAVQGMITNLVGELEDLRWASVDQAVARAREHLDVVVGIKVRLGYQMVGDDPEPALRLARAAADRLSLPLMVHVIDMKSPISWLVGHLGPGDVVTHCFHANEGGILDENGLLFPEVLAARERGVLFDVGHGVGSFAYRVARQAWSQGFAPDSISSDLHAHNVDGPAYDQATTLSKLLHVGMPLTDVLRATTSTPAGAVRRGGEIGSLAPGAVADATVFEVLEGAWEVPDGAGEVEVIERLIVPRIVVRGGELQHVSSPVEPLLRADRPLVPGS